MERGYIKLFRKIAEWQWYDDLPTKVLYIHLLLKANWEEKKWHGTTIKRGELKTSVGHLAKECGLSEKQVRTAKEKLESTGEIIVEATNKYTKIIVVNYDDYQSWGEQKTGYNAYEQRDNLEDDYFEDKQKINKRQSKDILMATTKELLESNKLLECQESNNICSSSSSIKISKKHIKKEFEDLWGKYPRKQNKSVALNAYFEARKDGCDYQKVLNGLEDYLKHIKDNHIDKQYIKTGGRWFEGRCWEDDYEINSGSTTFSKNQYIPEIFKEN